MWWGKEPHEDLSPNATDYPLHRQEYAEGVPERVSLKQRGQGRDPTLGEF